MNKKIFIVDDDKNWVRLLTTRLEQNGYKIDVAFDALQAKILVHKIKPDLMLLDMTMPAGGGQNALESVRNNSKTFNLPVIVMTGKDDSETKRKVEELGISAYFLKPFDMDKFITRIRQVFSENGK